MNIAIFGATGGTGRPLLQQTLAAGHSVQALVRTPSSLDSSSDQLTVIEGNVLDETAVAQTIAGTDAVLCTLGTRQGDDPIEAIATQHIITAMHTHNVRRLIVITSLGVGDSINQVPLFFKVLIKTALKKVIAAKNEQETMIRQSDLDWTIIRPAGLTDGPATGSYTTGTDKSITAGQVSRADVADFMLKELETGEFMHQIPAIT